MVPAVTSVLLGQMLKKNATIIQQSPMALIMVPIGSGTLQGPHVRDGSASRVVISECKFRVLILPVTRFQSKRASGIAAAASHDDTVNDKILSSAFSDPILIRPRSTEIIHVVHTAFSGRKDLGLTCLIGYKLYHLVDGSISTHQ